jgi:hypothetical protein
MTPNERALLLALADHARNECSTIAGKGLWNELSAAVWNEIEGSQPKDDRRLPERLRTHAESLWSEGWYTMSNTLNEAADVIERLLAVNAGR